MRIRSGLAISARPMASICCSPPESVPPGCWMRSASCGNSASTACRFQRPARGRARPLVGSSRFSRTESERKMRRPCGTSAMPDCAIAYGGRPASGAPRKRMSPSRGGVRPATERMSVVLPMPLRPRIATIEPSRTSSDSPCST